MTFEELEKTMSGTSYDDYGAHEPLASLSCVYECESRHDGFEYQTEVLFAVPLDWLCEYKEREDGRLWTYDEVRDWLCDEYTSEDSQPILESAISENKVAFWKIS